MRLDGTIYVGGYSSDNIEQVLNAMVNHMAYLEQRLNDRPPTEQEAINSYNEIAREFRGTIQYYQTQYIEELKKRDNDLRSKLIKAINDNMPYKDFLKLLEEIS